MQYLVRSQRLVFALLVIAAAVTFAQTARAQAPPVVINEFRYRGPSGSFDEFIELYNNSDSPVTVADSLQPSGGGWAVVSGDNPFVPRFVVPAGTVIPNRGHYLITNGIGYSLVGYPAGNGTTAIGDGNYFSDLPDNVGLALFNTADPSGFTLANRLDAAGTSAEPNPLFREGAGLPPIIDLDVEYSFARHVPTPCTNTPNDCGTSGGRGNPGLYPQDTNDNAADFFFMDTSGSDLGAGSRLGAPSPENLSSPRSYIATFISLVDSTVSYVNPPNRVRNPTPDPVNNSSLGTVLFRRRFTNTSGAPITRLRFQVTDITTSATQIGTADLRVRTSTGSVFTTNDAAVCAPAPAPCAAVSHGTTLEEPPFQPLGGGWHSTLSGDIITLANPLAPGQSINFEFLVGVEQSGYARFFFIVQALP